MIRFEGELLPRWAELLRDVAARIFPVSGGGAPLVLATHDRPRGGGGTPGDSALPGASGESRAASRNPFAAAELRRNREDVQPARILGAWLYALDTMIQQAGKGGIAAGPSMAPKTGNGLGGRG